MLMILLSLRIYQNAINKYHDELIKVIMEYLFIKSIKNVRVLANPKGITMNS